MNFIIYEDVKKYINIYRKIIFQLMEFNNINYNIIEINNYTKDTKKRLSGIKGNKIYLLDLEVPGKTGIELAREIREEGDWTSPIIILSTHEEFKTVGYIRNILILDFVSKSQEFEKLLLETLMVAKDILIKEDIFSFKEKGELYQIPLKDILYIEKRINDNFSNIVTENKTYKIRSTIQNLEHDLNEGNGFIKTHRSYIVNSKNIRNINFEDGEIKFSNNQVALLSRNNKKKLREKYR